MAATEAAVTATAGLWVDQAAAAGEDLAARTGQVAAAGWLAFESWYSAAAVSAAAAEAAQLSLLAQQQAAGLFARYVAETFAVTTDTPRVQVPTIQLPPIRNGVDLTVVHARPAEVYRQTFALTGLYDMAAQRAAARAIELGEADLQLAARLTQRETMDELGVRRYRRVLRPELSKSGSCGLCVVASDRKYLIADLMPMHARCNCLTLPIFGEFDPGADINRDDLDRIYAAAGDTTAGEELKKVRVRVDQHGELGPVLTYRQHRFTGPSDLTGAIERSRAANEQRLQKLNEVLAQLVDAGPITADHPARLDYQRNQIARTVSALAS